MLSGLVTRDAAVLRIVEIDHILNMLPDLGLPVQTHYTYSKVTLGNVFLLEQYEIHISSSLHLIPARFPVRYLDKHVALIVDTGNDQRDDIASVKVYS